MKRQDATARESWRRGTKTAGESEKNSGNNGKRDDAKLLSRVIQEGQRETRANGGGGIVSEDITIRNMITRRMDAYLHLSPPPRRILRSRGEVHGEGGQGEAR